MKLLKIARLTVLVSAFGLVSHCGIQAQETNDIEQLKKQLREMQENFERVQREQRLQIEALTKKLEDLANQQAAEKKKLEQEFAARVQTNQPAAAVQPTTPAPAA